MVRKSKTSMHPLLKGVLYFLGIIIVLLIIGQIFLTFLADDYLGDYLKDQVRTSSNNIYEIHFSDLNLNLFSGSATIDSLQIEADTTTFARKTTPIPKPPKTLVNGTIGEVEINGINILGTVLGKKLSIGSISVIRPNLKIFRNPREIQADGSGFSTLDSTIYATISPRYRSLEVDEIAIRHGNGMLLESTDTVSALNNLNLTLRDIQVDSASAQSGRLFITDNFSLDTGEFRMKSSSELNTFSLDRFAISSEDQSIAVDSFKIEPRYPKLVFSRQAGQQKDRIELTVPEIRIKDVDYNRLIDSTHFYAKYVEINNARFEDFLYKSLSDPREKKTLPFIAFRNLNQPIKIDTLRINDSYISYSEYLDKAPQAGTITFEQLNASFYKISNYPEDIEKGLTTTLDIQTRAFGAGLLTLHFEFPMDTQNGFHTIEGNLNSMSLTQFNQMLKYVAFIQFDKGTLNRLEFDMRLTSDQSSGNVVMNYENMVISLLDASTMEQEGILNNIKTFIANEFIVNKNNTPAHGMKAGRISFERIEYKSIFNYWWKSLLSGIKDTIK